MIIYHKYITLSNVSYQNIKNAVWRKRVRNRFWDRLQMRLLFLWFQRQNMLQLSTALILLYAELLRHYVLQDGISNLQYCRYNVKVISVPQTEQENINFSTIGFKVVIWFKFGNNPQSNTWNIAAWYQPCQTLQTLKPLGWTITAVWNSSRIKPFSLFQPSETGAFFCFCTSVHWVVKWLFEHKTIHYLFSASIVWITITKSAMD